MLGVPINPHKPASWPLPSVLGGPQRRHSGKCQVTVHKREGAVISQLKPPFMETAVEFLSENKYL